MFAIRMHQFFKPMGALIRPYHVPSNKGPHRTLSEIISELCGTDVTAAAISNQVIDLHRLNLYPVEKVQEIVSLASQQKYFPHAFSFIGHKLYSIDALMACDINVIQSYKNYLYHLSPNDLEKGAVTLEQFKTLGAVMRDALVNNTDEMEPRYFASCH